MHDTKYIVIAAYDAGLKHSEGYVARRIVFQLSKKERILLVTRVNNVKELKIDTDFIRRCPNIKLIGYDLPKCLSWWKKGARGSSIYSYLWQMTWPLVLLKRSYILNRIKLLHSLNFHNDSIPAFAWFLGKPTVWGPINHNEPIKKWRMHYWPLSIRIRQNIKIILRKFAWRFDPLLKLSIIKSDLVLSAGPWVDRRLKLQGRMNVCRRNQLGIDSKSFKSQILLNRKGHRLVVAGRLDWIKGIDVAIKSLVYLPSSYNLTIIGDGPCKSFLIDLSKQLDVEKRVIFKAGIARSELLDFYKSFDIFLFPSAEAAGLVWIEALSVGLPVVGFDGDTELHSVASFLPGVFCVKTTDDYKENVKNLANTISEIAKADLNSVEVSKAAIQRYSWIKTVKDIYDGYKKIMDLKG